MLQWTHYKMYRSTDIFHLEHTGKKVPCSKPFGSEDKLSEGEDYTRGVIQGLQLSLGEIYEGQILYKYFLPPNNLSLRLAELTFLIGPTIHVTSASIYTLPSALL